MPRLRRCRALARACIAYCVCPAASAAAGLCTEGKLRRLLAERRNVSWACEGVHVAVIDEAPWDSWVFEKPEAFARLRFKAMRPLEPPLAEDVVWTIEETFDQFQRAGAKGAREWVDEHVRGGMAVAVEHLNSLEKMGDFIKRLFQQLELAGGVDLYMSRSDEQRQSVGSYGWHADSVDAFIYVLEGAKRVRVAGYRPGSKVVLDRVLGAGSAVYVPGGRFHHLLALNETAGRGAKGPGGWTKVLSFGRPNPNVDLLTERLEALKAALQNRRLSWSAAAAVKLPGGSRLSTAFSEIDAYDATGRTALHRRAAAGDSSYLTLLLNMGADVHLRTREEGAPARTALGLALCCSPDTHGAQEVAEALLDFGAATEAVEHRGGQAISAAQLAAERPGLEGLLGRLGGRPRAGLAEL